MKHYSPLRYPGGKARLTKFLEKILSKKGEDVVFVEPYSGGAGAAIKLLATNKVKSIIINDYDKSIYAFWKVAVFDTDRLIKKIKSTNVSLQTWRRKRGYYKNKRTNLFDLAFATFFLNRTNRSGIIEGGPIGGVDQVGDWKINARFNKSELIERLKILKEYRNKIKVYNLDGIQLLKRLQKNKGFKKYFIFIDPPYYNKGKYLYLNHYDDSSHQKLSAFLQDTKLDWLMTYDDTKYIKSLYPTKKIRRFKIWHSAHTMKKGSEILISSKKIPYHISRRK